jgi:F0F1-type ATP synthase beta subunit
MSHLMLAWIALTGLAVADYFRDKESQYVLLFINIFHFAQAGSRGVYLIGQNPFCCMLLAYSSQ